MQIKDNIFKYLPLILVLICGIMISLAIGNGRHLLVIILTVGFLAASYIYYASRTTVTINMTKILLWMVCLSIVGQYVSLIWISQQLRSIQLYRVMALALIVLLMILCIVYRKNILSRMMGSKVKYYLYFIVVWAFWLILGLNVAVDKIYSMQILMIYICSMFLTFTIPIFINDRTKLKKLFIALLIIMLITYLVGLLEKMGIKAPIAKTAGDDVAFYGNRMGSFFGNPNNFALFASTFVTPFALCGLIFYRQWRYKLLSFGIIGTTIFIVIVSASRSCLIALAANFIACFILFIIYKQISIRKAVSILLVTGFLLCVTVVISINFLSEGAIAKFSVVFETPEYLYTDSPRLTLLLGVMNVFFKNKLLILTGAGVGSFDVYFSQIDLFPGIPRVLSSLHNWWLQVFADGGIFIFLAFNVFYFSLLYQLHKIMRKLQDRFLRYLTLSVYASFIAFIIGSVAASGVYQFTPLWIQWGIALAIINIYRTSKDKKLPVSEEVV